LENADFETRLAFRASQIGTVLAETLNRDALPGEIDRPKRLLNAMRHGVLNGGKRLRPFLLIETADLLGGAKSTALRAAAAIECVHCYSLVHDDLPAMDDDDLRRGKPTVHKAFDEATAILAGDALLTLAFDMLSDPQTHADPAIRSQLVLSLARASGIGGMAGGQMLDLSAEHSGLPASEIEKLQAMKTGALIRAACEMGAIASNATENDRAALKRYGESAGRAFQLADDILDVTQTTAKLGKKSDKDQGKGKATLVSLYGIERCRSLMDDLVAQAAAALEPFGARAHWLRKTAEFIARRDH
jgi:farnesyl diphosphate synthase